jgi:hypothetical protein
MPFPKDPLLLHGGCNCKAIRYRVSVPPFADRPENPYRTPGVNVGDARVPFVAIDHCNDCRQATSSILPTVLITEASSVAMSCFPKDDITALHSFKINVSDSKRHWQPVAEIAQEHVGSTVEGTTLGHYISSAGRNRWFCTNCGTPIAYTISDGVVPPEWNWPKMFDIWLGTLDRVDLEKEYMRPERMLWCHYGVPWIKKLSVDGAVLESGRSVPRHPLTKIDKIEGEETKEDLEELSRLAR